MNLPLRIVLLDDDPLDATLVRETLVAAGLRVEVRTAHDRAGFVTALAAEPVDVVLADYSLPSFNGLAALALVREQQPGLPFIFVTGALGEEFVLRALEQGATDYVLKGDLKRLVPAVQRAVREAAEGVKRERAETALRDVVRYARCMLWTAEITGLPGWDRATPFQPELFHWDLTVHDQAAAAATFGFGPVPGLWARSRLPEDHREADAHFITALLDGASYYSNEFRWRNVSGELRWMHEEVSLQLLGPGRWRAFCVASDVTDRKRAELAFAESNEQLREVMRQAACVLWSGTVTGKPGWEQEQPGLFPFEWQTDFVDEVAAQRLVPLDVPAGRKYRECLLERWLPEDRRAADANSAAAFRSGTPHFAQNIRCRDRDGQVRTLHEEVSIYPLGPGQWKVYGVRTLVKSA